MIKPHNAENSIEKEEGEGFNCLFLFYMTDI